MSSHFIRMFPNKTERILTYIAITGLIVGGCYLYKSGYIPTYTPPATPSDEPSEIISYGPIRSIA